jgi:hypothetical protein
MISEDEAAQKFLERILIIAYKGIENDFNSMLEEGLPGRVDDPSYCEGWYKALKDKEKSIVREIIRAVIRETLFRVLVILDNRSGGTPIIGQPSDFALYLQSYSDWDSLAQNKPLDLTRFNSLKNDELHDMFITLLNS